MVTIKSSPLRLLLLLLSLLLSLPFLTHNYSDLSRSLPLSYTLAHSLSLTLSFSRSCSLSLSLSSSPHQSWSLYLAIFVFLQCAIIKLGIDWPNFLGFFFFWLWVFFKFHIGGSGLVVHWVNFSIYINSFIFFYSIKLINTH